MSKRFVYIIDFYSWLCELESNLLESCSHAEPYEYVPYFLGPESTFIITESPLRQKRTMSRCCVGSCYCAAARFQQRSRRKSVCGMNVNNNFQWPQRERRWTRRPRSRQLRSVCGGKTGEAPVTAAAAKVEAAQVPVTVAEAATAAPAITTEAATTAGAAATPDAAVNGRSSCNGGSNGNGVRSGNLWHRSVVGSDYAVGGAT